MSSPWPSEIKEAALEDYKNGVPVYEIDAKYGLSNGRLWTWTEQAGLKRRCRRLTEDQVRWIALAYESGENLKVIAKRYGVHETTVYRVAVRRNGSPVRTRGYEIKKIQKAIEQYLSGVPIKQIYYNCGVTRSAFYDHLAARNIPKRKANLSESKRRRYGHWERQQIH